MNVRDFEDSVWAHQGIRIVIRAPSGTSVAFPYDYQNKMIATKNMTWFRDQVMSYIGEGLEMEVIDGNGEIPNGNSHINTVRNSYKR